MLLLLLISELNGHQRKSRAFSSDPLFSSSNINYLFIYVTKSASKPPFFKSLVLVLLPASYLQNKHSYRIISF